MKLLSLFESQNVFGGLDQKICKCVLIEKKKKKKEKEQEDIADKGIFICNARCCYPGSGFSHYLYAAPIDGGDSKLKLKSCAELLIVPDTSNQQSFFV